MTNSEIAALEISIGPRGLTRVTSAPDGGNRLAVRKWLVAHGVDARKVNTMTLSQLQDCYDTDIALAAARTNDPIANVTSSSILPKAEPVVVVEPVLARGTQATPGTNDPNVTAALALLAEALTPKAKAVAVDPDMVRQIMRDEMPALIPTTRIEVKTGDKVAVSEGLHHCLFAKLVAALSSGLHCYLAGPAGSGKTTAAEKAAEALGHKFYIQGAVSGGHELLGYKDATGQYHATPFRQAFEHGGTICLDEIDAGSPEAPLVMNAAMANGYMAFPDQVEPVKKHADFRVIACANTFGTGADRLYVGRTQLDAATLDRFFFFDWCYDEKLEKALANDDAWVARVQSIRAAASRQKARMVISPRASINGAKAIAAGMPRQEVEDGLIWKGTDSELKRRIMADMK